MLRLKDQIMMSTIINIIVTHWVFIAQKIIKPLDGAFRGKNMLVTILIIAYETVPVKVNTS